MKHLRLILAILTLGLAAFSLSAEAESLYTSTLWTAGLGDGAGAACTITNITSSQITVTAQLISAAGVVVDSLVINLEPGKTNLTVGSVQSGNYYCKFIVPKANKVRANLQILAQVNGVVFMRAVSEAK